MKVRSELFDGSDNGLPKVPAPSEEMVLLFITAVAIIGTLIMLALVFFSATGR